MALTYSDSRNIPFKLCKGLVVWEERRASHNLNIDNVIWGKIMVEAIFNAILNSQDGDYIVQVRVLSAMKPSGW